MNKNEMVRQQFNRQADRFDNWSVPKNVEYLNGISSFILFNPEDSVLDVATGTGDFPLFIAPKVALVAGIDISEGMIRIANNRMGKSGLANVAFAISDVEHLPFSDRSFSVVNSKSAFHHMPGYKSVFSEMVRCCKSNGKIAVCDIVAFEDLQTDSFFEKIEKVVDHSHFRTLRNDAFKDLFISNEISIENIVEIEIEHILSEYLSHAVQAKEDLEALNELLNECKRTESLRKYWSFCDEPRFRKKVILILGRKK